PWLAALIALLHDRQCENSRSPSAEYRRKLELRPPSRGWREEESWRATPYVFPPFILDCRLYWLSGTAPNWRSSTLSPLSKPITGCAGRERPRPHAAMKRDELAPSHCDHRCFLSG